MVVGNKEIVGEIDGSRVGSDEEGALVGILEGFFVGVIVGNLDGLDVGHFVGFKVLLWIDIKSKKILTRLHDSLEGIYFTYKCMCVLLK